MLWLTAALAAEPTLGASFSGSVNRVGLNLGLRPGLVIDMPWQQEGDLLFGEAALKPQLDIVGSPAFSSVGAQLRFEPIAVMDLTPYALGRVYYGNFQTVVGYDDWDANYGDNDAIAAYVEEEPNRQASGWSFSTGVNGSLKAKAGPVVVVANGDISRWWAQSVVAESYDYHFERDREVLMRMGPQGGDTLTQFNGLVLYERQMDESRLRAGSITTWRKSWTADDTLLRSGLLVTLDRGPMTYVVLAQPYLRSRAYDEKLPPFTAIQIKYNR